MKAEYRDAQGKAHAIEASGLGSSGHYLWVALAQYAAVLQIDLHDLPKALQGAIPGRAFAYRFPARPGECVFDVQQQLFAVGADLCLDGFHDADEFR